MIEAGGQIVSAAALIPQSISYRGVELTAGVWDAVATDAAHRRQGHCRRLFESLESTSGADILFVQGVTWLYRRLGYHPALANSGGFNSGGRLIEASDIPKSTLTYRSALASEAPFLSALRARGFERYIVGCPVSEDCWQHDLRADRRVVGPNERGLNKWQELRILQRDAEVVGFFMHDPWDVSALMELEIDPALTTWRDAGATAIHATSEFGGQRIVRAYLPEGHPLFRVLPRSAARNFRGGGDWCVKIPDLRGLLAKLTRPLEANLAASPMSGWSGHFSLSWIDDGLSMSFTNGHLIALGPLKSEEARVRLMPGKPEALILGYRSIDQILSEDRDCSADEESEALLGALFPPGDSFLRPL